MWWWCRPAGNCPKISACAARSWEALAVRQREAENCDVLKQCTATTQSYCSCSAWSSLSPFQSCSSFYLHQKHSLFSPAHHRSLISTYFASKRLVVIMCFFSCYVEEMMWSREGYPRPHYLLHEDMYTPSQGGQFNVLGHSEKLKRDNILCYITGIHGGVDSCR